MYEQTAIATADAGSDAPLPAIDHAYYRVVSDVLKSLIKAGDEAAVDRLLTSVAAVAFERGVTDGFERQHALKQRRLETYFRYVEHPAWNTARDLLFRVSQADHTADEIDAILSVIGGAPMDEIAGDMAVALFKQGHEPASVARALLNAAGMRGRA